jgi:Plasmid encoded RepA protein
LTNSAHYKVVRFERAGELLRNSHPELLVSKRKLRQAEAIQLIRLNRDGVNPNLGFASRPFVLCGLPIKRPAKGTLMHGRRNGQFVLQVIGHPNYGVPSGRHRLVPMFLVTLATRQQNRRSRSAALPKCWRCGMQQGGSQYRRLIAVFQRVFGATILFGTDTQAAEAAVAHQGRFNCMREARILYSRDPNQPLLPGGFENVIALSDELYREVTAHSIPTDLETAKALSSAPAALDLYMLSWRCSTAKRQERIPIFGEFGLVAQLGSAEYARPRKFRERLDHWLDLIRCL